MNYEKIKNIKKYTFATGYHLGEEISSEEEKLETDESDIDEEIEPIKKSKAK